MTGWRLVFVLVTVALIAVAATTITNVYATAGNPKTPEIEIMGIPGANSIVEDLAQGGICAVDDNIKLLQEQGIIPSDSDAVADELRKGTIQALNDNAARINAADPNGTYPVTAGNPEDC